MNEPSPVKLLRMIGEQHRGKRVLLAEDNPVSREFAVALLEGAGLVVEAVTDGAAAASRGTAEPFDIVLMDLQMPQLDGFEAARRIRRAGASMPIVAVSAWTGPEDQEACRRAGMNDHVAKPVDIATLCAVLLRWLAVPPGPATNGAH